MTILLNYSELLFLGCLAFLLVSCDLSKKDEFDESYIYSFQKGKQLIVNTTTREIADDSTQTILNVTSKAGNNLVFHYEKKVTPPPQVMDGGSIRTIYFEIPPDAEKFTFEGTDLTNGNIYFSRSCFCPIIGALKVENGLIEGQKLSENLWSVSASLQPKGPKKSYSVEFSSVFIFNSN